MKNTLMGTLASSMRWPVHLYAEIRERAWQERKSVNQYVVEVVAKELGIDITTKEV